jgi:gamma-glutamyltranspeptidase
MKAPGGKPPGAFEHSGPLGGPSDVEREGGLRIRCGEHPEAAVSAPRWVLSGIESDGPPDELLLEGRVPDVTRHALAQTGLPSRTVSDYDWSVGHAQMITLTGREGFEVGSDPRSEGAALLLEAVA